MRRAWAWDGHLLHRVRKHRGPGRLRRAGRPARRAAADLRAPLHHRRATPVAAPAPTHWPFRGTDAGSRAPLALARRRPYLPLPARALDSSAEYHKRALCLSARTYTNMQVRAHTNACARAHDVAAQSAGASPAAALHRLAPHHSSAAPACTCACVCTCMRVRVRARAGRVCARARLWSSSSQSVGLSFCRHLGMHARAQA